MSESSIYEIDRSKGKDLHRVSTSKQGRVLAEFPTGRPSPLPKLGPYFQRTGCLQDSMSAPRLDSGVMRQVCHMKQTLKPQTPTIPKLSR